MLNKEVYRRQHVGRLVDIVNDGQKDGIDPNERTKRLIQSAINLENPFIKADDPFVVLGNDGLDDSWFPTGSFKTAKDALLHLEQKRDEEHIYSEGDEMSTTFHAFTRNGIPLENLEEMKEK